MKSEKIFQKAILLSIGLSAITLVMYAVLGFYVRMIADDYCSAVRGLEYGPIDGVIYRYQTWAAEYTNFFIKYSLASFQPEIHSWMGIFTLIMFLVSTAYLLSQLFKYINLPQKNQYLYLFTIILTFTFYRIMPSYQHAFWFAAVIPYTWAIIILIFFIGTALQYFSSPRTTGVLLLFLIWTLIVTLILCGFISIMTTSLGIGYILLLLMVVRINNTYKRDYLAFVLVGGFAVFIALIIIILSPGIEVRREAIVGPDGLTVLSPLGALPFGIVYTVYYIFGEPFGINYGQTYAIGFLVPLFAIIFLFAIFYLDKYSEYTLPAPKSLKSAFLISFLMMVLLIFSVMYPSTYAASGFLPMRGLILPRLIQLGFVVFWAYLAIVYAKRTHLLNKLRRAKTWSLVLIFISALIVWSPAVSIYKLLNLYPDYSAYAQSWDERNELILNSDSNEIIVVPQLAYDIEDSLVLEKLEQDETFWINSCAANFYGVDGIEEEPEE